MAVSFIGVGNPSTRWKSPTWCMSPTSYHIMLYQVHLVMNGIPTLNLVIGTGLHFVNKITYDW